MKRNSSPRSTTYSTALVAQGAPGLARLLRGPTALFPCYTAGAALPCRCAPGDNLALHRAIVQAQPGTVIVCEARGDKKVASFGELMALECLRRRIAGVVIYGAVRDAVTIERIGFPVFCMSLSPLSPVKKRAGVVGKPITVGGVRIAPGDQIIADRDGVLLVPASRWPDAVAAIAHAEARERDTRRRMLAGESLSEIIGLSLEESPE
jgi:4-hydroxy-4-methyl-2-oxoglutarate aldolase